MDPVTEKFGVELKARKYQGDTTLDAASARVNRAKASVYTWDDDRLQSTVVVKRKITKAATTIQRFIRACISHWEYFNQYKAPLVEELKGIERRRREELEEVRNFLKHGFDEAKVEIESEFSLPQEQFEKLKKTTDGLKKEIKQEEEEAVAIEKQINEQKHETRKLEKEKHELDARETLSRLDIEIPALEAERMEMEGVAEEFDAIIKQLKAQHDEMVMGAELEKSHKARLMKCLAAIVQLLEKREVKTKVIQSVKLSIKYKGEPPTRPASAPTPPDEGLVAPTTATGKTAALPTREAPDVRPVTPTEEKDLLVSSKPTMPSAPQKERRQMNRNNSSKSIGSTTTSNSSDSDPARASPKGKSSKSKRSSKLRVSPSKDTVLHSSYTTTKSTQSKSSRDKKVKSIDDSQTVFNWGDEAKRRMNHQLVMEASHRYVRSLSPSERDGSSSDRKDSVQHSRSDDLDALAAVVARKGRKLPRDAFDWAAMADDGVGKEKKDKKEKSKKKKTEKDNDKPSRKPIKLRSVSITGAEGVFKFAYER